jgi:hypothetical protein
LPTFKRCCGDLLSVEKRSHGKNKSWVFRCKKRNCRKEYSLKKNSFFEGSNLKINQILQLMFYFVFEEVDYANLKLKTGITSNHTISDWLSLIREV